jgi:hypothetical protein
LPQAPRRIGSHSLGEFPLDVVRIECERCGRAGRYAKARLIERFGADAAGPPVSEFGRSVPCHPPEQLRPERLWNGAVTVIGR